MSWKTFTDCKLDDSWKLLNTRADVSSSKKCDCRNEIPPFFFSPVSNTELKSAFGVKHNMQLLPCTPADDLLSSNTMFHIGFQFLHFPPNNLGCNMNQCGQWNKEKYEVWQLFRGRNQRDWPAVDEEPAARICSC